MPFVLSYFHCGDTLLYIPATVSIYLLILYGLGTLLRDVHSLTYLVNSFNYTEASQLPPSPRNTVHFKKIYNIISESCY